MTPTRISVEQVHGRMRATFSSGLLRPQLVHSRPGWCRIGLLATTALLLGGDTVEVDVRVGAGARLDLFDVAGTVALDGRGVGAGWCVTIRVAEGGALRFSGQPFVVADGAAVTRSCTLEVEDTGIALVRDIIVLGRTGERGGRLRNRTSVRVDGRLVCLEDQDFDPDVRYLPGMLGHSRVLDVVTAVGVRAPVVDQHPQVARFDLFGSKATMMRYVGDHLAGSPLHQAWLEPQLLGVSSPVDVD